MIRIQLIICMETNKKAATDYIYIKETINKYYEITPQVKLSEVYMGSKSRYNAKDIIKEITKLKNDFKLGETKVIYCIDTDLFETDINHEKEFVNISKYCENNEHELVWFCHDVEEVYLGKKVSDKQKVSEAGNFRRKNKIQDISEVSLKSDIKKAHRSNILKVLDKYLSRKK